MGYAAEIDRDVDAGGGRDWAAGADHSPASDLTVSLNARGASTGPENDHAQALCPAPEDPKPARDTPGDPKNPVPCGQVEATAAANDTPPCATYSWYES